MQLGLDAMVGYSQSKVATDHIAKGLPTGRCIYGDEVTYHVLISIPSLDLYGLSSNIFNKEHI
jgi:hypothetical protein